MDLQEQHSFHVRQAPTLMYKRFRVFLDNGSGKPADELVAFVQQDRSSFKEKVVVYADEAKEVPLVEYGARSVLEGSDVLDVRAADATVLGCIRRSIGTSLYRSTWVIEPAGGAPVTVTERSKPLAIARRAWQFLPVLGEFPFPVRHRLDIVRDGVTVGSLRKTHRFDDHFLVHIEDDALDRRLVLAAAIAFSSG